MYRFILLCLLIFSSAQLARGQYLGGINDGHAIANACTINLNGGNTFSLNVVSGSSEFCDFATEQYSVTTSGASQNTTIVWSAPPGATIASGQGTTSVLITFGNTAGNVRVDVSSPCATIFSSLAVTSAACTFFKGGTNDGFTTAEDCASNLNGGSVFIPGPIIGSTTFCDFASESYSITVAGTTSETTYTWSVPAGATITSGQGTTTILVAFGNTNGNVSVDVANPCESINVMLAVSSTACLFYAGGINDGFSNTTDCASNLNGGSTFIPGPIVGSTSFCDFASEAYSITVAGSTSETTYLWSAPPGASITSGQGTTTVLVTFGNTAGNISVDVSNPCETINVLLPVSSTSCLFYAGGNNDGFSLTQTCIASLNGTSAFIPGPIVGSTSFCNFATESYSISVAGADASTVYNWSVPAGAVVTSGQGTNAILVTFGNTAGNVSVNISNVCELINVQLAVAPSSCLFYAGGNSDGFAMTLAFNIPLPIELLSFEASVKNGIVQLSWITASELNNDYFTVERSITGENFEELQIVPGAGTSSEQHSYKIEDKSPFVGKSYYRLAQTDYDGTTSYSNIVLVDVNERKTGIVSLYPNPIKNGHSLSIVYYSTFQQEITVSLSDVSGKILLYQTNSISPGENLITVDCELQASGLYILSVHEAGQRETYKLFVQ